MTCAFCQRVRDFMFGRRRCEACEHAMRAIAQHERSTQNLTRAALDQIDHSAAYTRNDEAETSHIALVAQDALMARSFGGPGRG